MKNIFIFTTDKPSRLHYYDYETPLAISKEFLNWRQARNIYITSDEEIKEGDWLIVNDEDIMQMKSSYDNDMSGEDIWVGDSLNGYATYKDNCKKIILTTDPQLIQDGVQAIDDTFLEWFVKNPTCENVQIKRVSRCCGRCDGYHDLCYTDTKCDNHSVYGCYQCFGPAITYKIETNNHIVSNEPTLSEKINFMFRTLKDNSIDNTVTISNLDLFINSWKREFNL